ncbi:MAG: DNA double-strand break repair nuclease NurA [Phototrophicales bacterium]
MALEFNKLTEQVYKMGAMIEKLDFDMRESLQIAKQRFAAAGDPAEVHKRIQIVRQKNISGYRGAALMDGSNEPINMIYPAPTPPERATIIAGDGSQIYPNEQAPVHFYLINIGVFVYHHGIDHLPQQITIPTLYFHKDHVHDPHQRIISNRTVDARRTVKEMQTLAQLAWEYKDIYPEAPIIALYDNNLMFWADTEVYGGSRLMQDYHAAMQQLYDVQANGVQTTLAGYVDNPRGSVVLRLLHLLTLADETAIHANQNIIEQGGDLEGLKDKHLFQAVLAPGDRSAVMVQNSPRNFAYRQHNSSHEIAFFYIKVGSGSSTNIARVDIPVWVARNHQAVEALHGVLLAQSTMQGRNPYPYSLSRADELAYVSSKDKAKLDEMINLELRRKGIEPLIAGRPKARGKELARSDRTAYEINTDLRGRQT